MTVLTWRNVDAPTFRDSIDAYRLGSDTLNKAFDTAQTSLNNFDSLSDDEANRQLQVAVAAAQTPDDVRALQASLLTRPGADRIDGSSLAPLSARPAALLADSTSALALARGQYGFDRSKTQNANEDAAAPLLAGYYAAHRTGQKTADAYLAAHPELSKLDLSHMNSLLSDGVDMQAKDLRLRTGEEDLTQSHGRFGWDTWRFGNEKTDREASDEADRVLQQVDTSAFDEQSALQTLRGMTNLHPKVYNAVRARLATMFPNADLGAPAAGGGAGGIGGGDTSGFDRLINKDAGGGHVPDNVQNLGQFVDFGRGLNNKGAVSSSSGLFQINGSTMAEFGPKVFGANWASQPYNAQTQDKIGEAIFNQAKSSKNPVAALTGRWVSLSPGEASALLKGGWDQARGVIAQKESGVDPRQLALGNAIVGVGATTNRMERNTDNIASTYAKSAGDFRPTSDIAAELAADPAFKGDSLGEITSRLDWIKSKATAEGKPITAAVARDILKQSLYSSWFSRNGRQWLTGATASGMGVDEKKVSQLIAGYSAGDVQKAMVGDANQGLRIQDQALYQAKYAAAAGRYQRAIQAVKNGAHIDPGQMAQLKSDVDTYGRLATGVQDQNATDPGVTSFYRPPHPPVPVAVRRAAPASAPVRQAAGPSLSPVPYGSTLMPAPNSHGASLLTPAGAAILQRFRSR